MNKKPTQTEPTDAVEPQTIPEAPLAVTPDPAPEALPPPERTACGASSRAATRPFS